MTNTKQSHWIARLLFLLGFEYRYSTNIVGQITAGYGRLSHNGFWKFELFTND